MKRFNSIVNTHMLKLLEALPQDGGPVIDQNPSAPGEPARTSPQEKSNWEITLLDVAKTAIYNVKNNPDSLTTEDEEKLGVDVTSENKEEMLDLLYKLAGKSKDAAAPIPEPEPTPEPEPVPEPAPEPAAKPTSPLKKSMKPRAKAAMASRPV